MGKPIDPNAEVDETPEEDEMGVADTYADYKPAKCS